jgi:hypothetical protein
MNWRIARASLQGTSHVAGDVPCQDYNKVMQFNDYMIIAVADGLGSASKSDVGANIACSAGIDYICDELSNVQLQNPLFRRIKKLFRRSVPVPFDYKKLLTKAVKYARDQIFLQALLENSQDKDYACTMLLTIIKNSEFYLVHVGDGAVVGAFESENQEIIETISGPDNGEYANSTTPITSPYYAEHLRYACSSGDKKLQGIFVFTDGIQNLCINHQTKQAFSGFFTPILQWFREFTIDVDLDDKCMQLLNSPRIRENSDDDLTLVVCYQNNQAHNS